MTTATQEMRGQELATLRERLAWLSADLEHLPPHKVGTRFEADRLAERAYLERAIIRLESRD